MAARVLGTNMAHGKTKTNMASLILKSFFGHSFLDILKIRNITSFYSVSYGPLSHVRSRKSCEAFKRVYTCSWQNMCKEIFISNYQPRPVAALSGSGKYKKMTGSR